MPTIYNPAQSLALAEKYKSSLLQNQATEQAIANAEAKRVTDAETAKYTRAKAIQDLQTGAIEQQAKLADFDAKQLQTARDRLKAGLEYLAGTPPDRYAELHPLLTQNIGIPANILPPPNASPAEIEAYKRQAIPQGFNAIKQIDLTMAQIGKEKALGEKALAEAEEKRSGGGKAFDREVKLKNNFDNLSKRFVKIKSYYNTVKGGASRESPIGDVGLIFAIMKMFDPESVVREGEQATARNAASAPTRVRNAYNRALEGISLTPEQRQDFVMTAENVFKSQLGDFKKLKNKYISIADKYDLNSDNIITDYESDENLSGSKNVSVESAPEIITNPVTGEQRRLNKETGEYLPIMGGR